MKGIQRTHVSCGAAEQARGRGLGVCVLYSVWCMVAGKGAGSRGAARQSGVGHMHTRISLPPFLPASLLVAVSLSILVAVSQITSNQQHILQTHTHTNTHTDTRTVAGNLVA